MVENFLNLGKEMNIQIHEVQRILNRLKPSTATPKHIIIKWSKLKNKKKEFLKKEEERNGNSCKNMGNFLTETFQAKKEWDDIFKIFK